MSSSVSGLIRVASYTREASVTLQSMNVMTKHIQPQATGKSVDATFYARPGNVLMYSSTDMERVFVMSSRRSLKAFWSMTEG